MVEKIATKNTEKNKKQQDNFEKSYRNTAIDDKTKEKMERVREVEFEQKKKIIETKDNRKIEIKEK